MDERVKKILDSVEERKSPPLVTDEVCKAVQTLPARWREKEPDPTKLPPPESINGVNIDPTPKPKENNREYLQCLDQQLDKFEKATTPKEETNKIDLSRFEKPGSGGSRKSSDSQKMKEDKNKPSKYGGPLMNDYSGFQIAKRFHDENLKHQPLPDMIEDPVFKALGSNRHPHPGNALNVEPNASAIGWRGYAAPGPTQCSKMKVYRPKTAADKVKSQKDSRPKTSDPKREKRGKNFTQMDLAICWDLKPDNPSDEPKRSPHIDGSNGSAAPAVFAVVHPTEVTEDEKYKNVLGSAQAVAEHIPQSVQTDNVGTLPPKIGQIFDDPPPMVTNKEAIMAHIKPPVETPPKHRKKSKTPEHDASFNSLSPHSAEIARNNPKTAWTDHDTSKALAERLTDLQKENVNPNIMKRYYEDKRSGSIDARRKNTADSIDSDLATMTRRKHYQSSPNLANVGVQTNNKKNCNGSECGTEKSCVGSNCGSAKKCIGSNCGTPKNCSGSNCGTVKNCSDGSNCGSEKNFAGTTKNSQRNGKKKDRNSGTCDKSDSDSDLNRSKFKPNGSKNLNSQGGSPSLPKPVKIPKMRPPYAKRSYSIGTLIPPFSLWPDHHGQEYPEHWRLASVYQHSYKPIDCRRKPLLASVYQ